MSDLFGKAGVALLAEAPLARANRLRVASLLDVIDAYDHEIPNRHPPKDRTKTILRLTTASRRPNGGDVKVTGPPWDQYDTRVIVVKDVVRVGVTA